MSITNPNGTNSTAAPEHMADGYHRDFRWWVTRQADATHPVVHVTGWDGPHYVTQTCEMAGASRAGVHRWIDSIIERLAAAAARKRAKGRA